MNNYAHAEIYKGHLIVIENVEDPMSPMEWDNVGKMVTWHRNYMLGHEQPRQDVDKWLVDFLLENAYKDIEKSQEFAEWCVLAYGNYEEGSVEEYLDELDDDKTWELFSKYTYNLPLYLYDHGGISISTSDFSCPWDNGQIGFIYVKKEDAYKELDENPAKIIACLKAEVETYDDYLTGNVYGYRIFEVPADFDEDEFDEDCFDLDDFGDLCESLWGIYPDHSDRHGYDYALKEARQYVDWLVKDNFNKDMEKASQQDVVE